MSGKKDHKLAKYIENKIIKERYSPDAVIGEIKEKELVLETEICCCETAFLSVT